LSTSIYIVVVIVDFALHDLPLLQVSPYMTSTPSRPPAGTGPSVISVDTGTSARGEKQSIAGGWGMVLKLLNIPQSKHKIGEWCGDL